MSGSDPLPAGPKKRMRPGVSNTNEAAPPASQFNFSFKEKLLNSTSSFRNSYPTMDYNECDFNLKDSGVFVNTTGEVRQQLSARWENSLLIKPVGIRHAPDIYMLGFKKNGCQKAIGNLSILIITFSLCDLIRLRIKTLF